METTANAGVQTPSSALRDAGLVLEPGEGVPHSYWEEQEEDVLVFHDEEGRRWTLFREDLTEAIAGRLQELVFRYDFTHINNT
ncbi:MAG: hypothetical protein A3J09_00620 [Candidatus Zambryskibacteria bacterium RIFCSPLOWO2_02_FULL_51_21]|uniref:Uncharacterized protein n=1 Tax=Candidatus Zambryskibacteria bacterium RIFCSPHIGHO2_02_FULL_43_37 TaxID=1802749 RepID=A0A1G2THC6_9BACT|nr:MAG: hypothetical protein A2723_00625 [Candidatus Zambryskibacteria bacterium RIFCSPHIGHO2_01_FULL_52_18]OHA96705.1 MAG: hypothetical protein A3D49_02580 [Candidatus Zambryskibacteria bacterium RIFCSPHIGHO2_02_FULL_43_37]OHB06726.1 MAG: hypothetical protein A2944_02715 [Candidatus Zambryskibacteria bacterium RIFCSPLOWO2_01_FULL_52_12]OHB11061.1 MAG: hypothetical protein A3J09_00620 [Candidatus Zambryskibacteria bacterium RIFCSPLOWO2_02_FULL_51_21]